MKHLLAIIVVLFFGFGSFQNSHALSISPGLLEKLRAEGALDNFLKQFAEMHENIADANVPIKLNYDKLVLNADAQKILKVIVLLVDFSDNPSTGGSVNYAGSAYFDSLLFSRGKVPTGSLTEYYLENSYGNLLIDGDVAGWFRMPKTYSEYVGSNHGLQGAEPNARTLARDAAITADPTVNFALYDNDGNGQVEAIFVVVHAGTGAEETGSASQLWSHRWTIPPSGYFTNDGVNVLDYSLEPEEEFGAPSHIGVFCHEFGHVLGGLPDLYDVSPTPKASGLGNWSIMAGGEWNNDGLTPAHFDAWCKNDLDSIWGTFGKTITVTSNMTNVVLGGSESDSVRYRIILPGPSGKESFMIENRQQVGFDKNIPGAGLLILHCDDNLTGSNDSRLSHMRVSVEQADGLFELDSLVNQTGDYNDLFPGSLDQFKEFTNLTTPNTSSYYGTANQVSVWNIQHNTSTKQVTCNLDVTFSRTNLKFLNTTFSDTHFGNNNQIFDPGEKVEVTYTIKNYWKDAAGVNVSMSCNTPGISLGNHLKNYTAVASGQQVDNLAIPFDFTVSPSINPTTAKFDFKIVTTSPTDSFFLSVNKYVGGIGILLVDSDGDTSAFQSLRDYFTIVLDTLKLPYALWDANRAGAPGPSQYSYKKIIWYTGSHRPNSVSHAEVTFLRNYLDQGGQLFISGQDIAEQLSATEDSTFLRDYLQLRYISSVLPQDAEGRTGDPVGGGIKLRIAGSDGAADQSSSDMVDVLPNASAPFRYNIYGGDAGSLYAGPGGFRVVYFGFGFEAICSNKTNLGYATRRDAMERVLAFLDDNTATDVDEGQSGTPLPKAFSLEQNFPNPFNPTTAISYSVTPKLAGRPFSLDVFDILGQKVASVIQGIAVSGRHNVQFDAAQHPSGVYFYRLTIGNEAITRRMVLIK